jgi:hypothetical protein
VSSPRDVRHAVSIADIFDLAFLKEWFLCQNIPGHIGTVPVHVRSISIFNLNIEEGKNLRIPFAI